MNYVGHLSQLSQVTYEKITILMAHGLEVSTEKSKIMMNSENSISADISMNSQKLKEVTCFKYLGATLCKGGTC